jgi:hypothetical protein
MTGAPASIPHRVHLVGIGGMHMSAIARILLARGPGLRLRHEARRWSTRSKRWGQSPHDHGSQPRRPCRHHLGRAVTLFGRPALQNSSSRGPRWWRADAGNRPSVAGATARHHLRLIASSSSGATHYLIGAEVGSGTNAAPARGPTSSSKRTVRPGRLSYCLRRFRDQPGATTRLLQTTDAARGFQALWPGGTLVLRADSPGAIELRSLPTT